MPWWLIALVICTLLLILHRFYGASSPLQPFITSLLRALSLEGNTDAGGVCRTTLKLPRDVTRYKRLPAEGEFTPETMPRGLLDQHNTKAGVWGKICVAQGVHRPSFFAFLVCITVLSAAIVTIMHIVGVCSQPASIVDGLISRCRECAVRIIRAFLCLVESIR